MTVWENFGLGLNITLLGMGLVFLTLVLVMFLIWLLDRVFRPAAPQPQEQPTPSEAVVAAPPEIDGGDEIAAIAMAIALAREARIPARPLAPPTPSWESDEEIVGEVISVSLMDTGQATWRSLGRLKAQ